MRRPQPQRPGRRMPIDRRGRFKTSDSLKRFQNSHWRGWQRQDRSGWSGHHRSGPSRWSDPSPPVRSLEVVSKPLTTCATAVSAVPTSGNVLVVRTAETSVARGRGGNGPWAFETTSTPCRTPSGGDASTGPGGHAPQIAGTVPSLGQPFTAPGSDDSSSLHVAPSLSLPSANNRQATGRPVSERSRHARERSGRSGRHGPPCPRTRRPSAPTWHQL